MEENKVEIKKQKVKKSAPKKVAYTLKKRTYVNGEFLEIGDEIYLTDKGRDSFELKNRI